MDGRNKSGHDACVQADKCCGVWVPAFAGTTTERIMSNTVVPALVAAMTPVGRFRRNERNMMHAFFRPFFAVAPGSPERANR